MKVLISGAGIAGPTLAYWLSYYGMEPTLVEMAPQLRTGGYIIDFWGLGFEIADRMGLLAEIQSRGYVTRDLRIVNREGKRISGFPVDALTRAVQGRYISIARGDLAAAIFRKVKGKAETIFGESIARIEEAHRAVQVTFDSGTKRGFDLVVGADGLHSRVREITFGPQSKFEKYLGCQVAVFEVKGYRPRDELAYVMYREVGQQVGRFAISDDRTVFIFTFTDPENIGAKARGIAAQKELLHKRYGKSGWECPQIMEALDAAENLYFDRVSQIQMGGEAGSWTRGRVTLVGDAAFCVSLLAGQGSALAMVAAYILAGELRNCGNDFAGAFAKYQERFASFVTQKQRGALRFADFFAPKSKFSMLLLNQIMNLLRIQWVADLTVARDLADDLELPRYE